MKNEEVNLNLYNVIIKFYKVYVTGLNHMNIYFLRHGETAENKNKYYYGKTDTSLNEKGKEQAKKAGNFFKDMNFDNIYVSERIRTFETAQIALNNEKLKVICDGRINEMDFGAFEAKSYEQIKELYPEECKAWDADWKGFIPPEGESYMQFYKRIEGFMDDILKLDCKNVLIVTHGGVIRTVYSYILGGNMDFYWKFSSKNCDLSLIKYQYGNLFIDSITHCQYIAT